ncbi:MAG: 8-oxo-dGTP diphosphatase [Oscillospiraceae bacterium]|jgi:8-oxo-dGTP diphosphatase|nr:8-oxo-dGTP diphosphatase [Oscillospiraceae bacterium]
MPKAEITTMVMIQNPATGKVLVQERVKNWKGYAFPGGHINDGESLYDCAVREIREETGLVIRNLKSCGLVHWFNNKTSDRMMIFLYKTSDFKGEVISNDEGINDWMDVAALRAALNSGKQTNSFYVYQPLFFDDKYSEAFCSWNDDEPFEMEYR